MIHPASRLSFINDAIGYGVVATGLIPKGTIVFVRDELDLQVDAARFNGMTPTYRQLVEKYSYVEPDGMRVLSWDHAKYVNHSCDCNTMSTGYGFEIAIKDIEVGEEITDEYGLFNIAEELVLACNCANCRGTLKPTDIDEYHVEWDDKIRSALACVPLVHQPLWELLEAETARRLLAYLDGAAPYPSVRELKHEPRSRTLNALLR